MPENGSKTFTGSATHSTLLFLPRKSIGGSESVKCSEYSKQETEPQNPPLFTILAPSEKWANCNGNSRKVHRKVKFPAHWWVSLRDELPQISALPLVTDLKKASSSMARKGQTHGSMLSYGLPFSFV